MAWRRRTRKASSGPKPAVVDRATGAGRMNISRPPALPAAAAPAAPPLVEEEEGVLLPEVDAVLPACRGGRRQVCRWVGGSVGWVLEVDGACRSAHSATTIFCVKAAGRQCQVPQAGGREREPHRLWMTAQARGTLPQLLATPPPHSAYSTLPRTAAAAAAAPPCSFPPPPSAPHRPTPTHTQLWQHSQQR